MDDINHEIQVLRRRYIRLLHFDRGLWVFYTLTACMPAYFLFKQEYGRIFHASSLLAILGVGLYVESHKAK